MCDAGRGTARAAWRILCALSLAEQSGWRGWLEGGVRDVGNMNRDERDSGAKQLTFQEFLRFAEIWRETDPKSTVVLPCKDLWKGEFSASFLHPELDFCCP